MVTGGSPSNATVSAEVKNRDGGVAPPTQSLEPFALVEGEGVCLMRRLEAPLSSELLEQSGASGLLPTENRRDELLSQRTSEPELCDREGVRFRGVRLGRQFPHTRQATEQPSGDIPELNVIVAAVAASDRWQRLGRRRLTRFRMSSWWSDLPALCRRRRPRPSSMT